jgi:hypothetical protein
MIKELESKMGSVERANGKWFSVENMRFFGDVWYKTYRGEVSRKLYLVRATNAWTDMFGKDKTLHYRINNVNQDTLKIEHLIEQTSDTVSEYETWLEEN